MKIEAKGMGPSYPTPMESTIEELTLGATGLRVIVHVPRVYPDEPVRIEYHFDAPRGFRYLDEGDLLRYWNGRTFNGGHHLFEITAGGWMAQELQLAGMLSVTAAVGTCKEWFISTANACLNVLSVEPPMVREFG